MNPNDTADEWLRIVKATDPDTPLFDEALGRYQAEEDHAVWSAEVNRVIRAAESITRQASES